ncbi:MAG: DUF1385 domain-containing protein, partial [Actinomycetia bacterium]|nr:DUF1385 domain-containing protein [Actinomycetes bacterium]
MSETCTHIGGQAVIEGVMMRGKKNWAVAVRDPQGRIQTEQHDLASAADKNAWMKWPLVRGCVAMVESLSLGTKALGISAQFAGQDDEGEEMLGSAVMAGTMVVAALFAIFIFIVLPALATNLAVGQITDNPLRWNVVDGLFRALAFFLYVWVVGRWADMKRVFRYHGAEHKVIHTVEAGEELTVANAMKYSTMHVRCGTAFLLMVIVLSIVVFSLIPIRTMIAAAGIDNRVLVTLLTIVSRLLLLPLVAGLAYEVTVKWAGPRADRWYVKILLWPGLQMQRLTTAEPTEDMVEVAIAATNLIIAREQAPELADARVAVKFAGERVESELELMPNV